MQESLPSCSTYHHTLYINASRFSHYLAITTLEVIEAN